MTKFHFAKITTSEPKKDPELMLDISHTDPAPIWRIYVYIYISHIHIDNVVYI